MMLDARAESLAAPSEAALCPLKLVFSFPKMYLTPVEFDPPCAVPEVITIIPFFDDFVVDAL